MVTFSLHKDHLLSSFIRPPHESFNFFQRILEQHENSVIFQHEFVVCLGGKRKSRRVVDLNMTVLDWHSFLHFGATAPTNIELSAEEIVKQ